MSKQERIFFVQKTNNGEFETESIWCTQVANGFVVDNIPFIAKRVSLGDTIKVEYDEEDRTYYFDDFVSVSGNTTVRIFFDELNLSVKVRKTLSEFGCDTEVLPDKKIIAVNIPKDIDYKKIKLFLDAGEENHQWTYEESCLAR